MSRAVPILGVFSFFAFVFLFLNRKDLNYIYLVPAFFTFGFVCLTASARGGWLTVKVLGIASLSFGAAEAVAVGFVRLADYGSMAVSATSVDASASGLPSQAEIDAEYSELWRRVEIFGDGFRFFTLPSGFSGRFVSTNELGFRGPAPFKKVAERDAGCRISLYGDSAVFGWQAMSDSDVVDRRIEAALNEDHDVMVFNFGMPAAGPQTPVNALLGYSGRTRSDVIVLFLNGLLEGDHSLTNIVRGHATEWFHHRDAAWYQVRAVLGFSRTLVKRPLSNLALVGLVRRSFTAPQPPTAVRASAGLEPGARNLLEIFLEAARARGSAVIVVQQPNLRIMRWREQSDSDLVMAFETQASEIADLVAAHAGVFVDLTKVFENQHPLRVDHSRDPRGVFVSTSHWTQRGAVIVGDAVADILRRSRLLSACTREERNK